MNSTELIFDSLKEKNVDNDMEGVHILAKVTQFKYQMRVKKEVMNKTIHEKIRIKPKKYDVNLMIRMVKKCREPWLNGTNFFNNKTFHQHTFKEIRQGSASAPPNQSSADTAASSDNVSG